jgi:CP family cyanate transporter-like MFS transporter
VDLRLIMLAVPPVIPLIHRDLHLNETGIGALNSLPVLLLAVAAVPGSFLIARLGARRALIAGLIAVAVTGAARGVGPSVSALFAMTFLMGVGVAVSQPAMPSVVKDWFPARVARGTALYANGFLVGEILPTSLSSQVLALVAGSWQLSLAFWSLPVAATALLIVVLTKHGVRDDEQPPARWWPDWRSWKTWQAGLVLGCISMLYWGSNAFLPDFLHATQRPQMVAPALAVFNAAQLPVSILIALLPTPFVGHRWPFVVTGLTMAIGVPGMLLSPGDWVVFWTAVLGAVSGLVFVCALALPPLLARRDDVGRLSAAMFTITYTCSFAGPLLGGALWDLSGRPLAAFAPSWIAGFAMVGLAATLRVRPEAARPPVDTDSPAPSARPQARRAPRSADNPYPRTSPGESTAEAAPRSETP